MTLLPAETAARDPEGVVIAAAGGVGGGGWGGGFVGVRMSAWRRVALCVCVCWASLLLSVDRARRPKCTPGLCSGVQGSVSCSPEAGKLQSSQAENCSGVLEQQASPVSGHLLLTR